MPIWFSEFSRLKCDFDEKQRERKGDIPLSLTAENDGTDHDKGQDKRRGFEKRDIFNSATRRNTFSSLSAVAVVALIRGIYESV